MLSYESWYNKLSPLLEVAKFEDEKKLKIIREEKNFYYSNTFLKEEGEEILKKTIKADFNIKNFVFQKIERKIYG